MMMRGLILICFDKFKLPGTRVAVRVSPLAACGMAFKANPSCNSVFGGAQEPAVEFVDEFH